MDDLASFLPTLRALDPQDPLPTLSLPEWLARSLNAARPGFVREKAGKRHALTIPKSLAPSSMGRSLIRQRILELERARVAIDLPQSVAAVTDLWRGLQVGQISEVTAESRARAYMVALDDLPTWAVREACRRWVRHQAEIADANYNFAPSPPILRMVALGVVEPVDLQLHRLRSLLEAQPVPDEVELSEEHRGRMLEKLAGLFKGAAHGKR